MIEYVSFAVILIAVDYFGKRNFRTICLFAIVDFLWSVGLFALC
jgi:hypothetical protein